MNRSCVRRWGTPLVLVVALLAGCGGAEPDSDSPADVPDVDTESDEVSDNESADDADSDEPVVDAEPATVEQDEPTTVAVDTSVPPEADPNASAADHPGFEWAFDRGHQAGLYGRLDYYEPTTVSEPGSMAGLVAEEAYRDGFAKGLADAVEREAEQQAAAEAAEQAAAEAWPVGELLEGWDPHEAVHEFFEVSALEGCDIAAADDQCLDLWRNLDNNFVVLARLDPTSGPEHDYALLLRGQARGFEVQEYWDAEEGGSIPDWAQR